MTAGSATINIHEACCHTTSDHAINFCIDRSTHSRNVDRVLKSFQTASSINQSSVVYNFISESNISIYMCSSSTEYESKIRLREEAMRLRPRRAMNFLNLKLKDQPDVQT